MFSQHVNEHQSILGCNSLSTGTQQQLRLQCQSVYQEQYQSMFRNPAEDSNLHTTKTRNLALEWLMFYLINVLFVCRQFGRDGYFHELSFNTIFEIFNEMVVYRLQSHMPGAGLLSLISLIITYETNLVFIRLNVPNQVPTLYLRMLLEVTKFNGLADP